MYNKIEKLSLIIGLTERDMFGIHRRFHLMGGRLNKFILKHNNNFFCLLPMMAFFLLLFFLIPTFFESTKETQANTCSVYFTVMALDLDGNNSMDVLDEVTITTVGTSSTETIYDESYAYTKELIFTKPQTISLIYIINIVLKDGYYAELDESFLDFMPPDWDRLSNTSVSGICTIDLSNDSTSFIILYRTQKKYQIEYDLKNGTHGREHPTSAGYGDSVTISNPTRTDGYHFTGWTLSNYLSTAQYRTSSSWYNYTGGLTTYTSFRRLQQDGATVKFTANWKINTYRVRYNANGGSDSDTMSDQTFTYGKAQKLTENTFTRVGHTFAGWNTKADGSGESYGDEESVNNLTTTNGGTVTLYAQWTAQNLKANFNYNGGTVVRENDSQPYSSNGTRLSEIPPKKDMSRTGYTFKGWSLTPNDTGVYYDSTTDWNDITVTTTNGKGSCKVSDKNVGNIEFTLYAIWKANEYKVTLDQQGGRGGTTTITATYDSAMPTITVPSKFGYTFEGYYDSSGTKYYNANGTSARNWDKDSTATLKAKWTPYSYTLTLNGNGGTTKTGQQTITQSGSYASTLTLDSKPFIQKGYIFKGWSTTKDGAVIYLDGANYSSLITSNPTSITLYAQWEETWANHASSSLKTTEINGVTYNVIASAEDLAYLSKQSISSTLVGKYIQTADIDLSDYTWLPIGSENAFCGEYLGQGHKITGLHTSNAVDAKGVYLQTYGGLFGKLGKNATTNQGANVIGVYLSNKTDTTNTYTIYGKYTAGIAGLSNDKSINIEACILENIEINGNTTASFVGTSSAGQIKDCLLISSNISTANTTTRGFYTGTMTVNSSYYMNGTTPTQYYTSGASSDYSNWVTGVFKYPLPKALIWYPGA